MQSKDIPEGRAKHQPFSKRTHVPVPDSDLQRDGNLGGDEGRATAECAVRDCCGRGAAVARIEDAGERASVDDSEGWAGVLVSCGNHLESEGAGAGMRGALAFGVVGLTSRRGRSGRA